MAEIDISFHDDRISMGHWWPRISDLDVPVPATECIRVEYDEDADGFPFEWDTAAIVKAMETFPSERAFLRTDRKSASMLAEGSFLHAPDAEHIDVTVMKLLDMMVMSDMRFSFLAVREWLDLDAPVESYDVPVPTEVRVFVDEGDVLCHHLRTTEADFDLNVDDPEGILAEMEAVMNEEWVDGIRPHAEKIAEEFDGSGWSVDFVRTEDGEWVCTDMAPYGLYYHAMDEAAAGWKSLSYHESGCPHNLEEHPPESLPAEPENAREKRLIDD